MHAASTYYVQSLGGWAFVGGRECDSMSFSKFSILEAAQWVGMLLRKDVVEGAGHSKKGAEASVSVFFITSPTLSRLLVSHLPQARHAYTGLGGAEGPASFQVYEATVTKALAVVDTLVSVGL